MNLSDLLKTTAVRYPDREAVVWKSQRLTYSVLHQDALRLSSFLIQQGIAPGDRVALVMENSPNYLVAYFGVLMAGACIVALNPNTTTHELQHPLEECEATAMIAQKSALPALTPCLAAMRSLKLLVLDSTEDAMPQGEPYRTVSFQEALEVREEPEPLDKTDADTLAQIIYTSGTTGRPKGIMLTHANLLANTDSIVRYLKLSVADRILVILPFFYSYGNSLLLTHVAVGGTLVIADQFVFLNALLSLMQREQVTGFSGVPSSFAMLLRQSKFPKIHFDSLRYLTCAGGALPVAHLQEIRAAHPDVELIIMYGQTEASARLSYLDPLDLPRKLGSIGKGIPGVELGVVDPNGKAVSPGETGEIIASGTCIMAGYWKNPEETLKVVREGRLHTGDMATVDEEGYIFVKGRKSDIIKCGSYRTHPLEIEGALNAHADVLESAVVGIEDEMLGESISAFVVRREKASLSVSDLLQSARQFLPPYKLPKDIIFVSKIPKTASGKIRRAILREQLRTVLLKQKNEQQTV